MGITRRAKEITGCPYLSLAYDRHPSRAVAGLFWSERDVGAIMPRLVTVKVESVEQLDAEIVRSQGHPSSVSMFISEHLLAAVQARWEEMRQTLQTPSSAESASK